MKTARDWKIFYARERATLGDAGLRACLDRADAAGLPARLLAAGEGAAAVFPHTRLETSGELPAAAALAAVRSGRETVLALGVLHRVALPSATLAALQAGDPRVQADLRRVHGPDAWEDEFSLDNFCALLDAAAHREGCRRPPRVVRRFPFLTGERPADLPGVDELLALRDREDAFVVATADPLHHGAGYDTPPAARRPRDDPATLAWARASVQAGFDRLAVRDHAGFLRHAAAARSDFQHPGPVLAHLLGAQPLRAEIHALRLVDYADALAAPAPTWVAGALATFTPA